MQQHTTWTERFEGVWRLDREIKDHLSGRTLQFDGEARFAPDGSGGLILQESGLLRAPGAAPMRAERRYLWRPGSGTTIDVAFDDGRPFHSFDWAAPEACADHDCPPDAYAVAYDFSDWPVWRMTWRVRGPRKDYLSLSVFRPA